MPEARRPFQGVRQIVRFNWPFYVGAALLCPVLIVSVSWIDFPPAPSALAWIGIAVTVFWLTGSLAVSCYVYDVSPLYRWDWLSSWLSQAPTRWVNIHSGFDETSVSLREQYPSPDAVTISIHDERKMTEPSIKRARALFPDPVPTLQASAESLPLPDGSMDLVFVIFSAHELRDPEARLAFFNEVRRVVRQQGHVLLVEHVRDLANFVAFGPGFRHFLPHAEWLRLAAAAGFVLDRTERMTPFVRIYLLRRPG